MKGSEALTSLLLHSTPLRPTFSVLKLFRKLNVIMSTGVWDNGCTEGWGMGLLVKPRKYASLLLERNVEKYDLVQSKTENIDMGLINEH